LSCARTLPLPSTSSIASARTTAGAACPFAGSSEQHADRDQETDADGCKDQSWDLHVASSGANSELI
jgi:hypothetical protein